jgi:tRNA/tmRNA/rRNA uracil-C5-methylase (TrmA/RlmC/RlmD family)
MSSDSVNPTPKIRVGDRHQVTVGVMVHGGHALAYLGKNTIFVRHACPGEVVIAEITSVSKKIIRADAIEIISASSDRVMPPCVLSVPGGCGGCDWQFAPVALQRQWKSRIISESLERHGGLVGQMVDVEPVPGDEDGLMWRARTHINLITVEEDEQPRPAFKKYRSSESVPFDVCPVLTQRVDAAAHSCSSPSADVWIQEGAHGSIGIAPGGLNAGDKNSGDKNAGDKNAGDKNSGYKSSVNKVVHEVRDRSWRIDPQSFWQAHVGMAEALVDVVLDFVGHVQGQTWWDLYAGSGLLSAFLAERTGALGTIHAVEESPQSVREGRRSLHDLPQIHLHNESTERWLRSHEGDVDGVVLDPPRTGAGSEVIGLIVRAAPSRIIYVACDPVALGRDAGLLTRAGYRLTGLRALDGFPMTHHVECVAFFTWSEIS